MKRELGIFERALVISDRYAPFHSVYVLQLETPPPSPVVGKTLKFLQKRHPFLRTRLLEDKGKYFFASLIEPALPFRVLPRWNDTHWVNVVEVELGAHIEWMVDPLFRCTYLYDENQKCAEIILTFSQSIMDAASVGQLLDELLTVCASLMNEGTVTAHELFPVPPLESRFPSAFRGFQFGMRTLGYGIRQATDELLYRLQTRDKRTPPLPTKPSHGHIISLCLPEAFVITFLRRCDMEKVAPDTVLQAALLIAINRHLYAGKNTPMRTYSLWNMRPYVEPPLQNENLGRYTSPLRHSVLVEGGINVWQLARSLQLKFYRSMKAGDHYVAAVRIEALLKRMLRTKSFRMGATALSFNGELPVKRKYGEMSVTEMHSFISAYDLGPEFSGQVRIFQGELHWDFTYLDTDMSPDEARAVVEEIKSILNFAVTSPLFRI
ncbi:MAG: hypothetical protein QM730_09040 [Anaerolineales bacterium]